MIKEFKKKKFSKQNNKFVKIKKDENNLFIIIKKLVFLDESESDFLSKIKLKTDKNIITLFKKKRNIIEEYKPANYYEYYLIKNLINAKKIDKKMLNKLFDEWLQISRKDKKTLINEFNNL